MDTSTTALRLAAIRAATASLTATAAIALVASPALADDYEVKPGDTVSRIAAQHGTTVSAIVTANELDSSARIYVGQHLTMPGTAAPTAPTSSTASHTVAAGDNLWNLAATYGTTVKAIEQANQISNPALIRIGQVLTIPGATVSTLAASTPAPIASEATTASYTVAPGDTLTRIASRFHTTVSALSAANNIANPSLIRAGQVLVVPAGSAAPPAPTSTTIAPETLTYTVQAGDTVGGIAARYGVTTAAITSANALGNPSLIRVGQVLTIPGANPAGLVGDTFLGRTYPADVVAAANVNKATLNATDVPSRTAMQQMVIDTASSMGVSTALAQAIAYQESGFNQRAVSPANAVGTMQVIPSSGVWASGMVGRDLNLLVAQDNVTAGVAILRHLTSRNSLEVAIASYYQGERSVRERGMNSDTKDYVASVLSLMERFD